LKKRLNNAKRACELSGSEKQTEREGNGESRRGCNRAEGVQVAELVKNARTQLNLDEKSLYFEPSFGRQQLYLFLGVEAV
jgi:hypothetical protein